MQGGWSGCLQGRLAAGDTPAAVVLERLRGVGHMAEGRTRRLVRVHASYLTQTCMSLLSVSLPHLITITQSIAR